MASRTTTKSLPENVPIEDFNLQKHIEMLQEKQNKAGEWSL